MAEKKRAAKRSDRPPRDVAEELKAKREQFVQTFFKKGAELTEELVRDNERLRKRLAELDRENAQLRVQLASDDAIRDLLRKIAQLESEKSALLSSFQAQEEATGRFTARFNEIETDLESFANLYVASYQLHSTLGWEAVVRHLKELLVQLVGARSIAIYLADEAGYALVPIASEGPRPPIVTVHGDDKGDDAAGGIAGFVERSYLTGVEHVPEGEVHPDASNPAACVPIRFESEVVGVIVVYDLLPQKSAFVSVDRELFRLLGAHAGSALVAAELCTKAGGPRAALAALAKDVRRLQVTAE
jgi:hypothetical protein